MKFIMKQGKKEAPIFILLHGTGGTEESLLDVGKELNSDATLVGIRGEVLENGYPRYFKRLEEGIFDVEDLKMRAVELHQFIQELMSDYRFDTQKIVLVGYSNGANIGIKLLLDYPKIYQTGILFHPMYPVPVEKQQDLPQTKLFVTMGRQDPIVSVLESQQVLALFRDQKADVAEEWTQGHQLTYVEVEKATEWLEK